MADWNRTMDESNERFDSLFTQLRQQNGSSSTDAPNANLASPYHAPSNPYFGSTLQQRPAYLERMASPLLDSNPLVYSQISRESSGVASLNAETPLLQLRPMAPIGSGGGSTSSPNIDRTANLLNLLKFSQPTKSVPNQAPPSTLPEAPPREQNTAPSGLSRGASDLLATLMGNSLTTESKPPVPAAPPNVETSSDASTGPPANTQAYLLKLLNRQQPSRAEEKTALDPAVSSSPPTVAGPSTDVTGLAKALEATSIKKPADDRPDDKQPAVKKPTPGMFTYVNPFEQLAASSPRNRTPKSKASTPTRSGPATPQMQILKNPKHAIAESSVLKRKVDDSTSSHSPEHSRRKLTSTSMDSSPLTDDRSPVEAPKDIGAAAKGKETVSEAVRGVGNDVDKEVGEALARAEKDNGKASTGENGSQAVIQKHIERMNHAKVGPEFEETAQAAAMSIKKELDKSGNEHVLEDILARSVAEEVREIVEETAQGHIADDWESVEDTHLKEVEPVIKVYNLPLKPFISIAIRSTVKRDNLPQFRADGSIDVARFDKDFDQIDRTLVTASNNFIVYSMLKGGLRVIAQQNGEDVKVFTETKDHIFNVSLSTSTADSTETVIGTGVSGTVYWATLRSDHGDSYVRRQAKLSHTFALPPIQSSGEESSGGMLKTRARKSSSHPEFFAVGRGKSIHIIWPSVITKQGYLKEGPGRVVDTEKYLNHRSLKINTGKAGKDFTFSQDDTTIVSLDKAGRVKFWDVRTLTNTDRGSERYPTPEQIQPVEIKEPLMTLITTPANEKSWPTSVLFVDKHRSYQKGGALRYLIVGMKQNHTLQLWDLGLGKPVQELHLPHEKESDAVCSVTYHPATGMIVVGHPTRNSIYLIHLSSPRYNLPKGITQAEYAEKLVARDPSIAKPDSTAVMSGIREYSFANKRVLRSLDMLVSPAVAPLNGGDSTLFELYAMHSLGVSIITIKNRDLGWNEHNQIVVSGNAEDEGMIAVEPLRAISTNEPDAPPPPPQASFLPRTSAPRNTAKENTPKKNTASNSHADHTRNPEASTTTASSSHPAVKLESAQLSAMNGGQESAASGTEKSDKKRKKRVNTFGRGGAENVSAPSAAAKTKVPSPPETPKARGSEQSTHKSVPRLGSEGAETEAEADKTASASASQLNAESLDAVFGAMQRSISGELSSSLESSMNELYLRINKDRQTQLEDAESKQEVMLGLISSSLQTNVEASLGEIVAQSISRDVVPLISNMTTKAVHDQLGVKLGLHLKSTLAKELQSALPDALIKAMQRPDAVKLLSESITKTVAPRVEEQFSVLLENAITPALNSVAAKAAQKASDQQVREMDRQHRADNAKIEQLTKLVTGLTETVSSMAASQSTFQGEFLRLQQAANARLVEDPPNNSGGVSVSGESSRAVVPQISKEDEMANHVKDIKKALLEGRSQDAFMRWMQSQRQQEVFEQVFAEYEPTMVEGLIPLLLLAIGSTLAASFEGDKIYFRLAWIDAVLQNFMAQVQELDDDIREVTPKMIGEMVTRLEHFFMRINTSNPHHEVLKRVSALITLANRILEAVRNPFHTRASSFGDNRGNAYGMR